MKNKLQMWFIIFSLISLSSRINGQNICLDFDGGEYIKTPTNIGGNDFTIAMWFLPESTSTNTNCSSSAQSIFLLDGPGSMLKVMLCGRELHLEWIEVGTQIYGPATCLAGTTYSNTWNHIALTRKGNLLELYVNCVLVNPCHPIIFSSFDFDTFLVSDGSGSWVGKIDDVRIWDFGKKQSQICAQKNCVLSCNEPGLQLYWTFDEGMAGGNNTSITESIDCSPSGNNGSFSGFVMSGATSNYHDASSGELVYPNLNNTTVAIKDYPYQDALLTQICPGDPAHFLMLQDSMVPRPFNNVTVSWYYYDNPSSPHILLPSPPFTDFKFGIPSGILTYDCSSSTDGFADRTFYAISTVQSNSNGSICDYKSEAYTLQICCEIDSAVVNLTPPDPICEDEAINILVNLNSPELFLQNPLGSLINIQWSINGTYDPSYDDMTSFPYADLGPYGVLPTNYCFEATITNCDGKSASFQSCIRIDREPICGTIDALPMGSPQNLTLVSTTPHLIYEICPDNDAIIGIDIPFQFCNAQWQYSYSNTTGTWIDLGYSNSIQNTNILPTATWTSTSIYYRVQCNPLFNPSGCDPCFSNLLEIRLKSPPIPDAIVGISQLCKGTSNTLTVASSNAGHSYTWYCDGLQVGVGTSFTYTAEQSACYWLESTDGCYVVESPQYCVTVCELIPVLTCPLLPNNCACLGTPITLSACGSYSSCSIPAPNLQFTWYVNNVLQPPSGCTINHTPPSTGASYRVEIVNTATGCSTSAEKIIVPCDKN